MISEQTRKNLLSIATAFARATDLSLATVSRKFHGKHGFLINFSRGDCSVTVSKLGEMLQSFSNEWPEGKKWPTTKPLTMSRPAPKKRKKSLDN